MTKKERLAKYRNVYDQIGIGMESFMCLALKRGIALDTPMFDFISEFEELILFAPNEEILRMGLNWTDPFTRNPYKETARNFRLTVLAFCIAMCEDK